MSLRKSTRDPSVNRQNLDDRSLGVWARKGVSMEDLQSLDRNEHGEQDLHQPRQKRLFENIPDITRMLQNDFPKERLSQLQNNIPPGLYAEAWHHGIDPSDINKARNIGYYNPVDSKDSRSEKTEKESRRFYPSRQELGMGTWIPGNLPHYVSARIGGATHNEVLDAARMLHPWNQVTDVLTSSKESVPTETHGFIPLEHYARHRNSGGTHSEFEDIVNHIKLEQNSSTALNRHKIQSANNTLSKYSTYRENGADHNEALHAVNKFSTPFKNGLSVVGNGDRHFINTLVNHGTPAEYWNAVNNKYNPEQYSKLRETMSHGSALERMKPEGPGINDMLSLLS